MATTTGKSGTTRSRSAGTTKPRTTTTRKSTAKTTTTARKAPSSPPNSDASAAPKAENVVALTGAASGSKDKSALRKKELVDRVVTASGMKKKDVKPVVEAALAVLGEALSKGEEMNLQPLGKLMINNSKEVSNAQVLNVRIRRSKQAQIAAKAPLAKPDKAE